jgi:hypothetical protein
MLWALSPGKGPLATRYDPSDKEAVLGRWRERASRDTEHQPVNQRLGLLPILRRRIFGFPEIRDVLPETPHWGERAPG